MAIQLKLVMGQLEQVNLPGTSWQHPNWNRKLPKTFEELTANEARSELFERINRR